MVNFWYPLDDDNDDDDDDDNGRRVPARTNTDDEAVEVSKTFIGIANMYVRACVRARV